MKLCKYIKVSLIFKENDEECITPVNFDKYESIVGTANELYWRFVTAVF